MPEPRISMSQKEIDRYAIIKRLIKKRVTGSKAAELLGLSLRQTRRLKAAVDNGGAAALVHRHRGRKSNRSISDNERARILALITAQYLGFGPTLTTQHLADDHDIFHHKETIRQLMITEQLWKPKARKQSSPHHSWRQRRAHAGEMEQFDGSYHNWLEGRDGTDEQCLLAAIDDATGKITHAQFADHEGVVPVFRFWTHYLETFGRPVSIYLDKFSTYRTQERFKKEQEALQTQFERAMEQLRIEPITAHSPQAKGRVERLFQTLQDRLIKEMRLQGISTIEGANRFLRETFIPDFNARFAVAPRSTEDLHRPLTATERRALPSIFSRHSTRTVNNDFTVSLKNQWYQLDPTPRVALRRKEQVTIEEHLDHTIHIRCRGKGLNHHALPERPKRSPQVQTPPTAPWVLTTPMQTADAVAWKPAPDHPWRQYAVAGAAGRSLKR